MTCAEQEKYSPSTKYAIMYIGSKRDSLFTKVFVPFMDHHDDEEEIEYIHIQEEECAAQFNVKAPKLIFFRNFDTQENIYQGKADLVSFQTFAKNLFYPAYYRFDQEWMHLTFTNAHPTVFLYRPIEDENAEYM